MFFLQTGDIIPGKQIGLIEIGKDVSDLLELSDDFEVQELSDNQLYNGGDVRRK